MSSDEKDTLLVFAADDDIAAPQQQPEGFWDILVVDDEQEVHSVTRMVLTEVSFLHKTIRLTHAYSAASARELLTKFTYAVVLLDVMMETDNAGLELVEFIRSVPSLAETRIVLCTGHPGQAPEERVIVDYDIDDYREKSSLTSRRLKATVFAALRSHERLCINREQRLELDRSKSRIEALIEALPSAIVGIDAKQNIILWSGGAQTLTGIAATDALGLPCEQALQALGVSMELVRRVIEQGEARSRLREHVTLPVAGQMVRDLFIHPVGASGGVVLRIDNVTMRDRIEGIMVQSEKMVSLGSMAAGMAHELNNPLGAVLQGVDTVRRRLDSKLPANAKAAEEAGLPFDALARYMEARRILHFLGGIESAGRRAADIVKNMLDFSRQSGEKELVNVHRLIDLALELAGKSYNLRDSWDFRRISVNRQYDVALPEIPCSSQEIEQVLLNLFQNAAQAMTPDAMNGREPQLTITTAALRDGISIEVSDNGPGIPDDISRRVFDPFFTTKPTGKGTGLGLSVSYHIVVDRHGGEFLMSPSETGGASFWLMLPYVARCANNQCRAPQQDSAETGS
ncbi:ATP-binding protein [Oleidesulfovibrio sp.]|uniref:ATP-binding response regulator n=1 Tax=Oleidesulfovibrio sp. TaxID=2909707 RepID=UPI003A88F1CC